jgi:hypothetical protein
MVWRASVFSKLRGLNPSPDVEVTSLDFILGKKSVGPFVVAITAE